MELLRGSGLRGCACQVLQWHLRPRTTADGRCISACVLEETRSGYCDAGKTHLWVRRAQEGQLEKTVIRVDLSRN